MHQRSGEYDIDSLSSQLHQIPAAQIYPDVTLDLANTLAPHALAKDMTQALAQAILNSVDPHRSLNYLIRFIEGQDCTKSLWHVFDQHPQSVAYIINIFAGSQFLSHILLRCPELLFWLLEGAIVTPTLTVDELKEQLLKNLVKQETEAAAAATLRNFTNQYLLQIGARDLNRLADIESITADLSALAECVIQAALQFCRGWLDATYGPPVFIDDDGREQSCEFCVIGMGKLGGRELNFSSDIDLMYVYTSYQGQTRGLMHDGQVQNQISNHEYFVHLARRLTNLIGGKGPEGQAFRVDLRLRPDGAQGQLALSLLSYEAYYARMGQTWEKMALIKARPIAGPSQLGAEFIELIQPFVYQRHLDQDGIRQIQAIKQQIDTQIADKKQSRTNVKLGLGGIREIEFFIQILQLLFAGRQPVLQERHSLRALNLLREAGLISAPVETTLRDTYCYLRELEHRLQMEQGAQTHMLPRSAPQQLRIARLFGFQTWENFFQDYLARTETVHEIFSNAYDSAPALSDETAPGQHLSC